MRGGRHLPLSFLVHGGMMRSGVKVVLLTIDIHDIVSVAEQLQEVHVVVVHGARTSPSLDQLTPNAKERCDVVYFVGG